MISIKIKIPKSLEQRIRFTETSLNKNVNSAIKKAAYLVHGDLVKSIQRGSRSGKIYKRRSVEHQASASGEYPKTDTGRLVASLNVKLGNLYASVGTNIIYAQYLVNMNRLFLEDALKRNEGKIQLLINEAIEKSLNE